MEFIATWFLVYTLNVGSTSQNSYSIPQGTQQMCMNELNKLIAQEKKIKKSFLVKPTNKYQCVKGALPVAKQQSGIMKVSPSSK